jgi:site-specific DNA-methyltransferase (adenine-specific)
MFWQTPPEILDLVERVAPIGFDPCPINPTFDGLKEPWHGRGLAYINPPYGRAIAEWTEKAAWVGSTFDTEIVMLIPARTDTIWWQRHIVHADAIAFWRGRIRFVGAAHGAPFPSAFPYWGPHADRFCQVFDEYGWTVKP